MIGFLSNILFLEGIFFIILFFYSLLKQNNRFAAIFSIMCLSIAIYVTGYGFELRSDNIEQIKFFLKTEYFGLSFTIAFGMIFSYKFHFNKNPSLKLSIIFLTIPMLTLFFISTNEYHHLFYASVSETSYEGFIIANILGGPWYFVNVIYSYIVLSFGIIVFYWSWSFSQYKLKTQAFWLFFGSIWPGLVNIPYMLGFSPLKIDITPFGFGILAVSYSIAVFFYNFLELKEMISSFTFSHIREGIIVVDDKNRLIDFNNAAQIIFNSLDIRCIGIDFSYFWNDKKVIKRQKDTFEIEIIKDNQKTYYEFRRTVLREKAEILGYIYFIQDITKQKEFIQELNNMATYDYLTQIYNRRRLMEEAEKELFKAKSCCSYLSVLMIDIDHFKKVNDKYGHLTGDEVIKVVVKACTDRLRITDIIGRYGGEEFIIILPDTNKENAVNIAESIRVYIQNLNIELKEEKINVTVSIGVTCAIIKDNTIDIKKMMQEADKSLYYAKNHGRNQVCTCELSSET
jgi:diguanylate cyclase (GGDEF)-like protein